ncbi:MAG: class I fructose-bisphosphate aldolase [Myxococcales bacterium]|nr:class I fructose-bisphosphate aldolase [Myxococcales bacterium]
MTDRVKEILSWYGSDNVGVLSNLYKLLMTGRLAGTGKLVILPVDQGFEHGPARSFSPYEPGYDPRYHHSLAVESGCNGYAAPFGALCASSRDLAGQVPTILKLNNSDTLYSAEDPCPAITSSVQDAIELGCSAIGFTIYPGSSGRKDMYEEIREISQEARTVGLPTVIWSYPRGSGLSKEGETAIDVVAYGAHLAAQLGAHIIKVKPPTAHLEQTEAKKAFGAAKIPISTLEERIRHVVQSCFGGRRIVIFSGGASKSKEDVIADVNGIAKGGGFGSIMGRNAFQRDKAGAIALLHEVQDIFAKV